MLDWILGIVILIFIFLGLYKGLVREVFGFLSLLLGLYFSFQYMGELSGYIVSIFSELPDHHAVYTEGPAFSSTRESSSVVETAYSPSMIHFF